MTFPQGLLDTFETAERSIFRLETLQHYAGDPNFDRFVAGQPWQDTESKDHWCDLVRRRTSEGVSMQRVHVVQSPVSDYLRFEMAWSYPPNVRAGEDVRMVLGGLPELDGARDFWLFDDRELWWLSYDAAGGLISVDPSVDVSCAATWKRVALEASTPVLHDVPA